MKKLLLLLLIAPMIGNSQNNEKIRKISFKNFGNFYHRNRLIILL